MYAVLQDLLIALRFLSRLPVPRLPGEADPHGAPDFSRAARAVPLAGALLGAIGAGVLVLGVGLGLAPLTAALLAVAALIVATGAFHEDGLADTADGFGGGPTAERKLAIMKDSRIGTYGASALVLALLARVLLLGDVVAAEGVMTGALGLIALQGLSRAAALTLPVLLPPARREGAAYAAGVPSRSALGWALASGAGLALLLIGPAAGLPAALAVLAATALVTFGALRLAQSQIQGQTGDVAGAAQQAAEVAGWLALALTVR